METRSPKIQELRCMWGLFSILESCQGHQDHKLISNGRRVNKHIVDYPRKSFDEECRRIQGLSNFPRKDVLMKFGSENVADQVQKEVGLRSVAVDVGAKTSGNFDEENMPMDDHKSKRNMVNIREHIKMDSELNRIVKTQKRERKNDKKAYYSSSCCLDNAGCSVPSTSAEISLNKLTLAAILEAAVCAPNHQEDSRLSEYVRRSNHLGKYEDEIHIQQVKMRAKAFVDQMVINRKFVSKEGGMRTRSMNRNVGQKSDKIVILKPAPRNAKHSENVTIQCSLLQAHNKSSRRLTTSFSFREMKRKLKHTFGGSRKEESLMVGNSEKLNKECFCGEVDIRKSVNSKINMEQMGIKKDVKSNRNSGIARETDAALEKLDFSSVKKKEFDVILEAKRHLSARLRNINSLEGSMSEKSPRTLQRVLASPEHDFRPHSPHNTSHGAIESNSQVSNGRLMEAKTCSLTPSTEEVHDNGISTTDTKSNCESEILEANSIRHPDLHVSGDESSDLKKCYTTRTTQINDAIKPQKDEEFTTRYTTSDSLSENDGVASTGDYFPSTPFNIYKFDMANTIKYHEEHQSPVSVLEPLFVEDSDSPLSTTLQSDKKQLQPRRLDFEECSFESNSYMEDEEHLIQYVLLVLQASNLNWDQLSHYPLEQLLHESLFDEVELPPLDCYYDPKLVFDHINEVLIEMYKCHCCSPHWLTLPRIMSTPLVEVVLGEVMTEAEFYLLPTTEKRTLDQIVSRDVEKCRSWLDVQLDTERIVIDISEDVLVECILDVVLEFTL